MRPLPGAVLVRHPGRSLGNPGRVYVAVEPDSARIQAERGNLAVRLGVDPALALLPPAGQLERGLDAEVGIQKVVASFGRAAAAVCESIKLVVLNSSRTIKYENIQVGKRNPGDNQDGDKQVMHENWLRHFW